VGGRGLWVDRQCEVSPQSLEFFEVGTTENDVQEIVREFRTVVVVRLRPVEVSVRPGDVAVKLDTHRIGHAAHQKSSFVTASTEPPPDAAGLVARRPRVRHASYLVEPMGLAATADRIDLRPHPQYRHPAVQVPCSNK